MKLILAGKSDVALSQLAGRSLYQRLLKAGAHLHEYQPQILHAKLLILGDAVYVGSANPDPRSLSINYEVMVRFTNPQMATEASEIFNAALEHSAPIDPVTWKRSRNFGQSSRSGGRIFSSPELIPTSPGANGSRCRIERCAPVLRRSSTHNEVVVRRFPACPTSGNCGAGDGAPRFNVSARRDSAARASRRRSV